MVFWIAVVVGAVFAWAAVQIGFYGAWIMLFNLVLSAYMAIFLTPVFIDSVPVPNAIPDYGCAMTTLSIAIATLFISYGICYAFLSGHLRAPFPNVFDNVGAGLLGFLSGFLVCSFVAFTFSLTPLSEIDMCKSLGLNEASQKANRSYIRGCCDILHSFVSAGAAIQEGGTEGAMKKLLEKTHPKPAPEPEKTVPVPSVLGEAATAPPGEAGKTSSLGGAPDADATAKFPQAVNADKMSEDGKHTGQRTESTSTTVEPRPTTSEAKSTTIVPETKATEGKTPAAGELPWWKTEPTTPKGDATVPATPSATKLVSPPGATSAAPSATAPLATPSPATPSTAARSPASATTAAAPAITPPAIATPMTQPVTTSPTTANATEKPVAPPGAQGPLTGTWRALSGAIFQITDDGATAIMRVYPNDTLQYMSGKLVRDKTDGKTLGGNFDTVFTIDAPRKHPVRVTAAVTDTGELSLRCGDWPKTWLRGKMIERMVLPETLIRLQDPQRSPFLPDGGALSPATPPRAEAPPGGKSP